MADPLNAAYVNPTNPFQYWAALTISFQWGKDKAPAIPGFDGSQQGYSPQAGPTPGGYPGTPSAYFPQYGGMPQQQGAQSAGPMANQQSPGQFPGQQGAYGGPPAQSPAQYQNPQMGYGGPASAGGYGRGAQQTPNAQWSAPAAQNFGNGFGGYQG